MTGVLPVALEDATKTLQALLLTGKEYVCIMQLHGSVSNEVVQQILREFVGEIYQRPPLRSSVKRRIRTRWIYQISFLEMQENNVLFSVGCQAGTYIRKLCHDIGEALGCGAHMRELRRIRTGPFTEEKLSTLYDLADAYAAWAEKGDEFLLRQLISPMEFGLSLLPKIYIRDSAVDAICHGANLAIPGIVKVETEIKSGDIVAVFTQKGEAIALAKALLSTEGILDLDHGLATKTERVIMSQGVYPRMWRSRPKSPR